MNLRVQVESACSDASAAFEPGASAPAKAFAGEQSISGVVLEPFSLTLLIVPKTLGKMP
ncbi:MAG: hypothetical protein NTW86_05730 [Candidatus Sumerlaeota bacterium]|nr:hypothetical protein [Candidatus Sumerlaeota bacterium]